ncbi:MAG: pyridoxamine 5'-phosphate oxidase family protein [Pseudomonadota bacterium]
MGVHVEPEYLADLLLAARAPGRLASTSTNGFPLVSTLWFLYEKQCLWCITQERTQMRRNLARNSHCGFEIPLTEGYQALRGQGVAHLHLEDGARVMEKMIARYLGDDPNGPAATRLRRQAASEYAIRIEPRWIRAVGRRE